MTREPVRTQVLGVPVDCVDLDGVLGVADRSVADHRSVVIVAVNPEKVIAAGRDPHLRALLASAEVLLPDGIGVVLAMRLNGLRHAVRVPGSEVMPALTAQAAEAGYRVYLLGGKDEVVRAAVAKLQERHPALVVAGFHHGCFTDDDMPSLIAQINESGAQILFVALGSPKQERWIAAHRDFLTTVRVFQGVGGTFDVIAGHVQRAPVLLRRMNLEWFYRLATNPSRVMRQKALPVFAWRVLRQRLTGSGTAS